MYSETYWDWSIGATTINQLVDGGGVVGEVDAQSLVGEIIAVVGNEPLEVGSDLCGIRITHAFWGTLRELLAERDLWCSKDCGDQGSGGEDRAAHLAYYWWGGEVKVESKVLYDQRVIRKLV